MRKILSRVYNEIFIVISHIYLKFKRVKCRPDALCMHGYPLIRNFGKIEIGKNFRISCYQFKSELFTGKNGVLKIGDNVFVNRGVSIAANESIDIGENCLIGDMVSIQDSNWHEIHPNRGKKTKSIRIGKNVWIGKNCIILPGSIIGDHSVIGAGCVISGEVPAKMIVVQERNTKFSSFDCSEDYIRK